MHIFPRNSRHSIILSPFEQHVLAVTPLHTDLVRSMPQAGRAALLYSRQAVQHCYKEVRMDDWLTSANAELILLLRAVMIMISLMQRSQVSAIAQRRAATIFIGIFIGGRLCTTSSASLLCNIYDAETAVQGACF